MTYTETNGANSLKLACKALRNKERDEGGGDCRERPRRVFFSQTQKSGLDIGYLYDPKPTLTR